MKNFSKNIVLWIIIGLLLVTLFNLFRGSSTNRSIPQISFSDFLAAIDSGNSFECSEEALNQYLGSIINVREPEKIGKFIEFDGLFVRLLEGEFDLVFIRKIFGKVVTSSVRFAMNSTSSGNVARPGRFEKLNLQRSQSRQLTSHLQQSRCPPERPTSGNWWVRSGCRQNLLCLWGFLRSC